MLAQVDLDSSEKLAGYENCNGGIN